MIFVLIRESHADVFVPIIQDLSLLTSLSYEDIQALQTTGREQQEARSKFILANDLDAAWDCLSKMKNGRVDFVLDNAGFELVSDLMFADWLVSCTPYVSEVVFHAKNIPWFVSDVTPPDFTHTITSLLEPAFFSSDSNGQAAEEDDLPSRVERHRSISRSRQPVVDPSVYAEGKPRTPSRSRDLKMDENDMRGRQPTTASTARDLKMREGSLGGARNNHPAGSRALQMDPAYFKNARSRTISPTRSYVMDTTSFSALSIHEEGKASEDQTHSRSASGANAAPQLSNVQAMAQRWQRYLNEGRFKLSVPLDTQLGQSTGQQGDFWTEPVGYADMAEQAPELVKELQKAGLVIFKGQCAHALARCTLCSVPFRPAR